MEANPPIYNGLDSRFRGNDKGEDGNEWEEPEIVINTQK